MPNNTNERKGKQAGELSAEERFRNFFSTSVIDLPEEMTRRDEPAPVEEKPKAGLLAARNLYARLQGRELPPPPTTTMCGALIDYITTPNKDFQPMGANMGILPRTEEIDTIRDKRERYMALSDAAQAAMRAWAAEAEH